MVEHAGLSDRVVVEIGSVKDRLDAMQRKYAQSSCLTPLGALPHMLAAMAR